MTIKEKKYKGFNEIYFVLYLMAVLLLLPDGEKPKEDYIVSAQNSVYIKSEKSMLNVRLKVKNGVSEIVYADTVNIIYPVGKIDSINYNFKLNNNNVTNEIYSSKNRAIQSSFEIIENNEGLVRFEWFPQSIKSVNKNFEVIVEAEIYSLGIKEPTMSSTRFAINTYYIDNDLAINLTNNSSSTTQSNNNSDINSNFNSNIGANNTFQDLNDINFFPENPVTAMALSRWTSVVRVFGIDLTKDLRGLPRIVGANKYDIKIENIDSKSIYLSGMTSADSSYKVGIEIVRNADNRVASTEFIVKPLLIPYPDYKNLMYPNYTYTIKTNLPKNNKCSAKLYYKDKIVASSSGNSALEFVPQFSDTNKIFKLNRYVDDKLIDSKQDIRVIPPASPQIRKKSVSDGYLYITTKTYGKLGNGNNNIIGKLQFDKENIDYQDLNGSTQYGENYTIQVFRIKLKDDLKSLEIYAIDGLGEYSNKEKINF